MFGLTKKFLLGNQYLTLDKKHGLSLNDSIVIVTGSCCAPMGAPVPIFWGRDGLNGAGTRDRDVLKAGRLQIAAEAHISFLASIHVLY